MAKNLRKHPRFKVDSLPNIGGSLGLEGDGEILVTLAEGGAGFYAFEEEPRVNPPQLIICKINWQEEEIKVRGVLRYAKCLQVTDEKQVTYYGVEFLEDEKEKINGVVEVLQKLLDSGEISLA